MPDEYKGLLSLPGRDTDIRLQQLEDPSQYSSDVYKRSLAHGMAIAPVASGFTRALTGGTYKEGVQDYKDKSNAKAMGLDLSTYKSRMEVRKRLNEYAKTAPRTGDSLQDQLNTLKKTRQLARMSGDSALMAEVDAQAAGVTKAMREREAAGLERSKTKAGAASGEAIMGFLNAEDYENKENLKSFDRELNVDGTGDTFSYVDESGRRHIMPPGFTPYTGEIERGPSLDKRAQEHIKNLDSGAFKSARAVATDIGGRLDIVHDIQDQLVTLGQEGFSETTVMGWSRGIAVGMGNLLNTWDSMSSVTGHIGKGELDRRNRLSDGDQTFNVDNKSLSQHGSDVMNSMTSMVDVILNKAPEEIQKLVGSEKGDLDLATIATSQIATELFTDQVGGTNTSKLMVQSAIQAKMQHSGVTAEQAIREIGEENNISGDTQSILLKLSSKAQQMQGMMMQLAYLDARLAEPSNRGLSDKDILNALARVGGSFSSPEAFKAMQMRWINNIQSSLNDMGEFIPTDPEAGITTEVIKRNLLNPEAKARANADLEFSKKIIAGGAVRMERIPQPSPTGKPYVMEVRGEDGRASKINVVRAKTGNGLLTWRGSKSFQDALDADELSYMPQEVTQVGSYAYVTLPQ